MLFTLRGKKRMQEMMTVNGRFVDKELRWVETQMWFRGRVMTRNVHVLMKMMKMSEI